MSDLATLAASLSDRVESLRFSAPVTHVYNPLRYAGASHALYCERYGQGPKRYLWLGMNPGPFGMAQTGVPFGEVAAVREWMGIEAPVATPQRTHPKRPVQGFECPRSEVSGRRLWGYIQARWGEASNFFASSFVYNYCPLLFLHESGKNLTPDKLPQAEQSPLQAACDWALAQTVQLLRVQCVISVGVFAQKQAKRALAGQAIEHARVLHPSPASPAANRGWSAAAQKSMREQGLYLEIPEIDPPA